MSFVHPAVAERLQQLLETPEESDLLLERWLRRFQAVKERSLRRTVLLEYLEGLDDASLLGLLVRLEQRARLGEAACRWLSTELALTPSVLLELPYDRLVDLHAAARDSKVPELVSRFVGTHSPASGVAPEGNPHLESSAGERTSAARHGDRMLLDRLLHDRDPRVVAMLLNNPQIVERDVVRMAAMRPTTAQILQSIAAHPRWGQRYRIRKAVAFNPHTPTLLARQILPTLLTQDLRELSSSPALTADLERELQRRRG